MVTGPDPNFPALGVTDYYFFPDPKEWDDNIIAVGGNLSPGMLLSAYEQGIFPWYGPEDPIIWQSPDPRCIIFPDKLHISASMLKVYKNRIFQITFNRNFEGVIKGCAETPRAGQPIPTSTWVSSDIISAYMELHNMGFAISAEAWQDGELVGGCYGVLMGKAFFGESMFAKKSNASKAAFLALAETLFQNGLAFIDCQVPSNHLQSLGGEVFSRKDFLELLQIHKVSRFNIG